MRIVRSIDNYEAGADLLLSIGVFDGVHIGHREILSRLLALRTAGSIVGALTFEHHPQEFLHPERAPRCLTTLDEKINLLAGVGLDVLFLLPFDERIQRVSARTFLNEILLHRLRTKALIVGTEWRFGTGREGDVALARAELGEHGCAFEAAPLLERDGEFAVLEQRLVADKHLRLALRCAGRPCAAMLFNDPGPMPERIRAAYRLDVNHYQGLSSLQLVLERWQPG